MNEPDLNRVAAALEHTPLPETPLARLLREARRLTRAEAGIVYLLEGSRLRPAVAQNDVLARRLGAAETERRLREEPLELADRSIAAWVAQTGAVVNVPDAYAIPPEQPYRLDRRADARTGYRTRSLLALPLADALGIVIGVLELINALNGVGGVIPFAGDLAPAVAPLLAATLGAAPGGR